MDVPGAPGQLHGGRGGRGRRRARPLNARLVAELSRVAWATVAVPTAGLLVASLPAYYARLRVPCAGEGCLSPQLTPEGLHTLGGLGVSADAYAAYAVALAILFTGVYTLVAALIVRRAPRDRLALLAAAMLALFGAVFSAAPRALVDAHPALAWPVKALGFLGFASAVLFVNLFPSGRFVPRWTRWAVLAWAAAAAQGIFFEASLGSPALAALNTLGFLGGAGASLAALIYRYRRRADPVGRQQIKWVVYGLAVALAGNLGLAALGAAVPALVPPGLLDALGARTARTVLLLAIPLAIGVAVTRHRLWDIDALIGRTVVWGALTASVIGLYALIVGGLGALLAVGYSTPLSLLAAGLIAVAFAPLKERVQRGVSRLLWGERDEPYRALSRLGRRLEAALEPHAVLPTIVETVAHALRLPYAAITLKEGEGFVPAATYGTPPGDCLISPTM